MILHIIKKLIIFVKKSIYLKRKNGAYIGSLYLLLTHICVFCSIAREGIELILMLYIHACEVNKNQTSSHR